MHAGKEYSRTAQVEEDGSSPSKTVPHKKKYSQSPVKCFGVDLTPDNIAVSMVYFVQGVLGLSRLAVSFYLKDDLHLDPAEVGHLHGFIGCVFVHRKLTAYFLLTVFATLSHRTCYPLAVYILVKPFTKYCSLMNWNTFVSF